MARGTVKWFSDSKGYGFITAENTEDPEVYVHHSAIVALGFRTLHPGETVEFDCYDGSQWRGSWDTSLGDTNLPAAVRVRIQLVSKEGEVARNRQPLELIVPLLAQTIRTNSATTTASSGGTQ